VIKVAGVDELAQVGLVVYGELCPVLLHRLGLGQSTVLTPGLVSGYRLTALVRPVRAVVAWTSSRPPSWVVLPSLVFTPPLVEAVSSAKPRGVNASWPDVGDVAAPLTLDRYTAVAPTVLTVRPLIPLSLPSRPK
jgi:hypothetical protein